MPNRPRVLMVGAFMNEAKNDGGVGGVMYATRSLFQSPISEYIDWIPLDSTMPSVPPPPFPVRMQLASKRIAKLGYKLLLKNVDIVYLFSSANLSFLEKGLMACIAKRMGKSVIFNPISGNIPKSLDSCWMRKWAQIVFQHSDRILCQSHFWKELYQDVSQLPEERFVVIPNWLETSDYTSLKSMYPSTHQHVQILYLGWLEKYKGILDLIEAVRIIKDRAGQARFVICGAGSLFETAQKTVKHHGTSELFDFRGWVKGDAKDHVLAESDIYVHPSHAEGLPNALLETMAVGIPPIATRVGAIPEVLHKRELGFLVDPHHPEQMGEAILEMLKNKERRIQIGHNAQNYVQQTHDIEVIWPRMLKLFQEVSA